MISSDVVAPIITSTSAIVHDLVHNRIGNDTARQTMETAMRSLARPDAAETIARVLIGN